MLAPKRLFGKFLLQLRQLVSGQLRRIGHVDQHVAGRIVTNLHFTGVALLSQDPLIEPRENLPVDHCQPERSGQHDDQCQADPQPHSGVIKQPQDQPSQRRHHHPGQRYEAAQAKHLKEIGSIEQQTADRNQRQIAKPYPGNRDQHSPRRYAGGAGVKLLHQAISVRPLVVSSASCFVEVTRALVDGISRASVLWRSCLSRPTAPADGHCCLRYRPRRSRAYPRP